MGCMEVWMEEWVNGQMIELVERLMEGWEYVDGRIIKKGGWMNGVKGGGWTDGWMYGWCSEMGGLFDGRMSGLRWVDWWMVGIITGGMNG